MSRTHRKLLSISVAGALALAAAACGSDDESSTVAEVADTVAEVADTAATTELDVIDSGGGGTSVSVVLTDGGVITDPTSVDAGSVEFVAKNVGGDLHNLVIVRGDDPASLPVDEDGAVIEGDLPEGDLVGTIAVVDAGTEESASFDLDAGSYILLCNIVTPTAVPPLPVSHFEDGMVTTFTVN